MHVFNIRTSASTDVTSIDYTFLQDPEGPTKRWNPERYQTSLYIADTESKTDVISTLENELSGAEWATVDYQWRGGEYNDPEYRDDTSYYHENHSLRKPVEIEYVEAYDAHVEAVYEFDGTEYNESETITVAEPEEYSRTFVVVGTSDGIGLGGSGVELGEITTKEPLDRIPRSGIETVAYPEPVDDERGVVEIGTEPESKPTNELLGKIDKAMSETGGNAKGLAPRVDNLETQVDDHEQRISDLEGS